MGQLIVLDVSDGIIAALKVRAAANRRSIEAEHRQILREALDPDRSARDAFKIAAAGLGARIGPIQCGAYPFEDVVRAMRDGR